MTCALLWLILLPYFGFRQIGEVLGEVDFAKCSSTNPVIDVTS